MPIEEALSRLPALLVAAHPDDETIGAGAFARVGDDLSRLIGRPSTTLVEGLSSP